MSPWKVILATLVIFVSGVVTGALVTRKWPPPTQPQPPKNPRMAAPPGPTGPGSLWHQQQKDFLRRLEKELDLTPEQRGRIESILKESHERTRVIRKKIEPELREEMKKVREQIRAELTLEQQKQFEESLKPKPPRKEDKPDEFRRLPREPRRDPGEPAPPPPRP